ncbi:MAG TPA: hypothetical protein VFE32_13805 [Puia sp.]|jgi:hypothetical protein|nr:hypothetical protein [Puia sp.]
MTKIDYRALIEEDQIQTLTDLVKVLRKDMIDTYNARDDWPNYEPTDDEEKLLWHIYCTLEITYEVPFPIFVYIYNLRKGDPV